MDGVKKDNRVFKEKKEKLRKEIKMTKELKERQKITQKELIERGWEKIGPYGEIVIFYKGEKALHYDPEKQKIDKIF